MVKITRLVGVHDFAANWRTPMPEHWHSAGPKPSPIDKEQPRRAATPIHTMLNYGYAIREAEAILASHAAGLDPALGLMHTDARSRGSLATDRVEPVRPIVDKVVLALLTTRELARGDIVDTREGFCCLGADLARQLATSASKLRSSLVSEVARLRSRLLAGDASLL